MTSTESELARDIPIALEPPILIDGAKGEFTFWSGQSRLRYPKNTIEGRGKIYLDLIPFPKLLFNFEGDQERSIVDFFRNSQLGAAVLEAGPPVGTINVNVLRTGTLFSGIVCEQIEPMRQPFASAIYLVLNGPNVLGNSIRRGRSVCLGRVAATVDGTILTMDALPKEKDDGQQIHSPTHVVRCNFPKPANISELGAVTQNLFKTLSLMACRWVGVLGPWLYDADSNQVGFVAEITKTMRRGGATSWCHEQISEGFSQLFPVVHKSFGDDSCAEALQTALHWLVESEQCAGGVEGSIILQQAALECLAWLEIVQRRGLCSASGFKPLPAADKIRWLLSLNRIPLAIADKSNSIRSYANEFNLTDLSDVLADVRNALVHAEPKKTMRLFSRSSGEDERSELWYQVGGILQLALLASLGYEGLALQRWVDTEFAVSAIRPVPWAKAS